MTFLAYLLSHGQTAPVLPHQLSLHSGAFQNMAAIPSTYSCKGRNASVPLHWHGVPKSAKSLVLIMKDRDSSKAKKYHWALYNIAPETQRFTANMHQLPPGVRPARNSFGKGQYQGPCEKSQRAHRYEFDLYALDARLPLAANAPANELKQAMKGHVLAKAALTGTFHI